jgi:hypothetical protein
VDKLAEIDHGTGDISKLQAIKAHTQNMRKQVVEAYKIACNARNVHADAVLNEIATTDGKKGRSVKKKSAKELKSEPE